MDRNPYAFSDSSKQLTGGIVGLSVFDGQGKLIHPVDIRKPVRISFPQTVPGISKVCICS